MRFGVLGPLAVWDERGEPVVVPEAKVRLLLAVLLAYRGRPVSADRLVEELWGDDRQPRDAVAALRVKVSQLRTALGDRSSIRFHPAGYVLDVPADALDAERFVALTAPSGEAEPRVLARRLSDALELWRGPAYADVADRAFAVPEIARLEETRLSAVEELAETRLALGEPGETAGLVAEHLLRERLRAVHMKTLYRAGRQSDALAAYDDLRKRLAEELGVDPPPRWPRSTSRSCARTPRWPRPRATAPTCPPRSTG